MVRWLRNEDRETVYLSDGRTKLYSKHRSDDNAGIYGDREIDGLSFVGT